MQEAFKQINLTDRDSQILNLCKWHVIGHVQSNKAKKAVQHFDMIQSVDSIKLLNKINKECALLNKTIPILLEINMGNETNKTGIAISDLPAHIRTAQSLENVDLKGLMAMGSFGCSKEQTNSEFMLAKQLFESFFDHNTHYLSMGMSDSFKDALNKGSNMIRLGTILFGQR
jgi:pyridoxal phosphate enzyme (YggS family)